jgi:hypothetical protein
MFKLDQFKAGFDGPKHRSILIMDQALYLAHLKCDAHHLPRTPPAAGCFPPSSCTNPILSPHKPPPSPLSRRSRIRNRLPLVAPLLPAPDSPQPTQSRALAAAAEMQAAAAFNRAASTARPFHRPPRPPLHMYVRLDSILSMP